MTTALLVTAGVWLVVALIAAFWLGSGMRHADEGEQRRLAREQERERHVDLPETDDRRSA